MKLALVVALGVALACTAWLLDRASLRIQLFAYGSSPGFYLNAVPVILLFLLLLTLCNRVALAFLLTLGLTSALYVANFLKLKYLAVPVAYGDVYLLGNLHVATIKLLSDYVRPGAVIGALSAVVAIVALSWWKEPGFFRRRSVARAVVCATALAGLFCIVSGVRWVGERFYSADALRVDPYSPILTIVHSGLISALVHTNADNRRALDEPVDMAAINAFMAMPSGGDLPDPVGDADKPDIVVIQSESFFDPAILGDIDKTNRALPNLHRALARGIGGTMQPPTFGGGTLRTEFEVLTGIPVTAFPLVEFPYLQITQKRIPSIIQVARDQGYETIALHANSGSFWNRNKAFKAIGFDRFVTLDDFPEDAPRDGWYVDDKAMTDEIIDQLGKAREPALIFAISIEAHGPYLHDPVDDSARRDAIPAPPGMNGKGLLEYRNYAYHIEDADAQLGRLWDYLASRQRSYVLMFYGDHLPALTYAFAQAGFDNAESGPRQFVPWFIVGSEVTHRTLHIDSWMIGSELLQAAGIVPTPYYRLVDKARRAMDGPDPLQRQVAQRGIESASRLYLTGKLAEITGLARTEGGPHAASARN